MLNIENETTKELNLKMEPTGNIHLFLQINRKNRIPFEDIIIYIKYFPYGNKKLKKIKKD